MASFSVFWRQRFLPNSFREQNYPLPSWEMLPLPLPSLISELWAKTEGSALVFFFLDHKTFNWSCQWRWGKTVKSRSHTEGVVNHWRINPEGVHVRTRAQDKNLWRKPEHWAGSTWQMETSLGCRGSSGTNKNIKRNISHIWNGERMVSMEGFLVQRPQQGGELGEVYRE